MITYDTLSQQWVWYDTKSNLSVATSSASYDSLLIGSHTVDFSGLVDDNCKNGAVGSLRRIKFTSCTYGQFTCSNGQCINIAQKCDQTEDCQDFSDEENCQIVDMNKRYKKNIAPFSYEDLTKR